MAEALHATLLIVPLSGPMREEMLTFTVEHLLLPKTHPESFCLT
jgi:hypothetical protein